MFDVAALRTLATATSKDKLYAVWADVGDASCTSVKTFKVTSGLAADQAEFKLYQVNPTLATDTIWHYLDANGSVVIPTVENMQLGVKLIGKTGYSYATVITGKAADNNDVELFKIDNDETTALGELFTVEADQKDVVLSVTTTANVYYFAFNENSAGLHTIPYFADSWQPLITSQSLSKDADNNWVIAKSYTIADGDKVFPTGLYSDEACLLGYALTANGVVVYSELTDALIADYEAASQAATAPYSDANPATLYAIWGACPSTTVNKTIALEGTSKGTYNIVRRFALVGSTSNDSTWERVYQSNAATASIVIPSNAGDISFTDWYFITNTNADVIVDTYSAFAYRENATSDWNNMAKGSLFTVNNDVKNIKAPLLKNSYTLAYSKNNDGDVFYGPDFVVGDVDFTINAATAKQTLLPNNVLASTNKCLDGWALDVDGNVKVSAFDVVALRSLDSLVKLGESVDSLYAVWATPGVATGCTPTTFKVTTDMPAEQGEFALYQLDPVTADRLWHNVTANGVEIPTVENMGLGLKFSPKSTAYTFNAEFTVERGTDKKQKVNGDTITVADSQTDVTLSMGKQAVSYKLTFNDNSSGQAFFGDSWQNYIKQGSVLVNSTDKNWNITIAYNVEGDIDFPMALYRAGLCLQGYAFSLTGDKVFKKLDDAFIKEFDALGYSATTGATLYAKWGACADNVTSYTIALEGTDKGKFTFARKFAYVGSTTDSTDARVYEGNTASFVIPIADDDERWCTCTSHGGYI